jgi:hypothetical protein
MNFLHLFIIHFSINLFLIDLWCVLQIKAFVSFPVSHKPFAFFL